MFVPTNLLGKMLALVTLPVQFFFMNTYLHVWHVLTGSKDSKVRAPSCAVLMRDPFNMLGNSIGYKQYWLKLLIRGYVLWLYKDSALRRVLFPGHSCTKVACTV